MHQNNLLDAAQVLFSASAITHVLPLDKDMDSGIASRSAGVEETPFPRKAR